MRTLTAFVLSASLLLTTHRAWANNEGDRSRWRHLFDQAVYVVEGGNHPTPMYKWSDQGDHDRTIAKNSALADITYQNRVIITDIFYKDYQKWAADLATVGQTIQSGYVMLRGYHYDLNTRIPLAIPATVQHACKGVCQVARDTCMGIVKVQTAYDGNGVMDDGVRQCLYKYFRADLLETLGQIGATFSGDSWDETLPQDRKEYDNWLALWREAKLSNNAPSDRVRRAMVIALGTPVSFYSHNPLKPVGYYFDTKNKGPSGLQATCNDTFDLGTNALVRGPSDPACSDFDLKIYWPDMVYDYANKIVAIYKGKIGYTDFIAQVTKGDVTRSPDQAAVDFLRAALPINLKIVDGGKQHVFKNVTSDGLGVYQAYPPLAAFVKRWTDALGREVDIKLEVSLSTPIYYAIPGGPIAVFDAQHSPSATIDVDESLNNESFGTENEQDNE